MPATFAYAGEYYNFYICDACESVGILDGHIYCPFCGTPIGDEMPLQRAGQLEITRKLVGLEGLELTIRALGALFLVAEDDVKDAIFDAQNQLIQLRPF